MNTPLCMLQVNQGSWCQESYETGSADLRDRTKSLRSKGFVIRLSSIGSQFTPWGRIRTTLVHIMPGRNDDTFGLPPIREV